MAVFFRGYALTHAGDRKYRKRNLRAPSLAPQATISHSLHTYPEAALPVAWELNDLLIADLSAAGNPLVLLIASLLDTGKLPPRRASYLRIASPRRAIPSTWNRIASGYWKTTRKPSSWSKKRQQARRESIFVMFLAQWIEIY